MPVAGQDWTIYAKMRGRASANDAQGLQVIGTGSLRCNMYLNYNSVTTTATPGMVSIRYINASGTQSNAICATGLNLEADWLDFVFHFDKTFNTLSLHIRQSDNTWKFGGHVLASSFTGELAVTCNSGVTPSTWVEFDFITLTAADLIAIGDSITAGATLFNPQQTLGLNNGNSTWMRWAAVYPTLRNNFIVNKGINGNSSAMVAARIQADVLNQLPRVVFLSACNNDAGLSVPLATRTTNIQNSVNLVNATSAKLVLHNAIYYTSAHPSQPAYKTYFETWWREYRGTVTGLKHQIDPMAALKDAAGYLDAAYCQSDNIHPNVAGYTRYGKYMAGKKYT